jgi:hypothetical protein
MEYRRSLLFTLGHHGTQCITPGSGISLMFLFLAGKASLVELHHSRLIASPFASSLGVTLFLFLVFICFPSCLSWLFSLLVNRFPQIVPQLLLSSCWLFNGNTRRKAVFSDLSLPSFVKSFIMIHRTP